MAPAAGATLKLNSAGAPQRLRTSLASTDSTCVPDSDGVTSETVTDLPVTALASLAEVVSSRQR